MVKRDIPAGAYVWYILLNIMTLGSLYFAKVVIMKAIVDAQEKP